eukprot:TRINITY_DN70584_c0_g1_i1.p1 TRINITY_DN70584_c0_g1~~TRINITY_DN70584_c0_g1_i1.p1  ORF type:complete len:321 (+),score=112.60 TRINITY_DN70584_c0_g1_i1:81-965(+)
MGGADGDGAPVGHLNRFVFITTRFLRAVLIGLCVLVILSYGFIMDSSCDNDKLTIVGKAFAVISSMGYILVMFVLLMVQLECDWFMKYFRVLDYWAVRSSVQAFMGVQILISKGSFEAQGVDTALQDLVLSATGWSLIGIGIFMFILSAAGARKHDHLGGGPKQVGAAPAAGKRDEPKLGEPLMSDDGFGGGARAAPPAAPVQDPFLDSSDPYPYARAKPAAAPAPAPPEEGYFPPAPVAAAPTAADEVGGVDPFVARRAEAQDDDIQSRRQREDDELERLYAQANRPQFQAAD